MSMVIVPYDIWLHISSYLSKNEIWRLRYLSHALLDISLDDFYRTVDVPITFRKPKSYIRDFSRFRDPDIARRVRHLSCYPFAFTTFPRERPTKTTVGSMKQRFQAALLRNHSPADADMVETMESFIGLVSLEIRCVIFDPLSPYRDCVPLIHTNFRVCYSQLQSLDFHLHLSLFPIIILPDLFLSSLTSLSMKFVCSTGQTTFEDAAATVIIPFINRHRNILTSVSFQMKVGENSDMGVLVQGLRQITSLKNIFMCISSSTRASVIGRFFEVHRKTLQVITIGMMERPYQRVDNILQDVTGEFPNLQEFSVQCSGFDRTFEPSLGPTLDFIMRCSRSLVSFNINGAAQTLERFYELLNFPGWEAAQDAPFMKLKSLNMGLQVLAPDMMDLLAFQLPNLHFLELHVMSLKSRHNIANTPESSDHHEFCLEMSQRTYNSWTLEHLVLVDQYTTVRPGRALDRTSRGRLAVFAKVIPNLKTFNGSSTTSSPPNSIVEVA